MLITSEIERRHYEIQADFLPAPSQQYSACILSFTSLFQENIELFLAGLLAAAGAFGLKAMFHITGAMGMRRSHADLSSGRDLYDDGNKASEAD